MENWRTTLISFPSQFRPPQPWLYTTTHNNINSGAMYDPVSRKWHHPIAPKIPTTTISVSSTSDIEASAIWVHLIQLRLYFVKSKRTVWNLIWSLSILSCNGDLTEAKNRYAKLGQIDSSTNRLWIQVISAGGNFRKKIYWLWTCSDFRWLSF